MNARIVPGLFVTGTDTAVGKTYIGSMIARSLANQGVRVGVYKPIASGCRLQQGRLVSDDAVALWTDAGRPGEFEWVCPQCFQAPLAPHLAAEAEGYRIDWDLFLEGFDYWRNRSDFVLVEGAGGLMCPLGDDRYVADLAGLLALPLLVVARNALGTINHTLQTLITASYQTEALPVAGIVLNRPAPLDGDLSMATNRRELAMRCEPPIVAEVGWRAERFDEPIDWVELASTHRNGCSGCHGH